MSTFYTREVVTVAPADSLADVASAMEKHNVGAVVVANQQRPVGIITDRDVALAVVARGLPSETPAQEVMTCPVTTLKQSDGIFKATKQIRESAARRLPVVDDLGRLVGIVSVDDLMLLLGREMNNLTQGIRPEMASVA